MDTTAKLEDIGIQTHHPSNPAQRGDIKEANRSKAPELKLEMYVPGNLDLQRSEAQRSPLRGQAQCWCTMWQVHSLSFSELHSIKMHSAWVLRRNATCQIK